MDIRQNHWNTIAGTGGNGRSCLEKFINSNHRRNVSQRKDFERFRHRERFSCFFLSIRSGNPKRNNSSKNRANRSFRNSRNVPNGFWNSSKNAPRAFYLFILFFFYPSLLEYQQKIEEPRLSSVIRRFLDSFYRSLVNGKRDLLEETLYRTAKLSPMSRISSFFGRGDESVRERRNLR